MDVCGSCHLGNSDSPSTVQRFIRVKLHSFILTCAIRRTRAHIVRLDAARGHIVSFHVDYQKVVPLPLVKEKIISLILKI